MRTLLLLALLGLGLPETSVNGYATVKEVVGENRLKHIIIKKGVETSLGICTLVRSLRSSDVVISFCGEEKENEELIVVATVIMNDFHNLYLKLLEVTDKGHSFHQFSYIQWYAEERGGKGLDQDWILLEGKTKSCAILMSMVSDIYMGVCGGYEKPPSILVFTAFSMFDRFHKKLREITDQ